MRECSLRCVHSHTTASGRNLGVSHTVWRRCWGSEKWKRTSEQVRINWTKTDAEVAWIYINGLPAESGLEVFCVACFCIPYNIEYFLKTGEFLDIVINMAVSNMVFSDVETFLDDHPELFEDYLNRKGKYSMVEKWLKTHQANKNAATEAEKSHVCKDSWASKGDGLQRRASQKELRKTFARSKAINANRTYDEHVHSRAQEPLSSMRRRALLRKASSLPPTTAHILSALLESRVNIPQYPSTAVDFKYYLKEHNEREFFLELVKDISNDLDLTSLSYKILVFVCIMVDADRCSLFLVEGTANKKTLVSKFFDVHAGTTVLPSLSNSDEVQVPWGKGIIGYVAEHGETVNIPDAYQVRKSDR